MIARYDSDHGLAVIEAAADALHDQGEGWEIDCSWGMAWIPSDTDSPGEALRLADSRMYAQKAARSTPAGQAAATLIQLLAERDHDLGTHTHNVTELALATARRLMLDEPELTNIRIAARGYPDGLAEDAIPRGAQIIAVCDAYDAMTTTRCYQAAVDSNSACAELRRCAGSQFSEVIVDAVCSVIEEAQPTPRTAEPA